MVLRPIASPVSTTATTKPATSQPNQTAPPRSGEGAVAGAGDVEGAGVRPVRLEARGRMPLRQLEPDMTAVRAPHAPARVAEGGRVDPEARRAGEAAYDHGGTGRRPLSEATPVARAAGPSTLYGRSVNPEWSGGVRACGPRIRRAVADSAARHGV